MHLANQIAAALEQSPGPTLVVCAGHHQAVQWRRRLDSQRAGAACDSLAWFATRCLAEVTGEPWRVPADVEVHLLLRRLLEQLHAEGYHEARAEHTALTQEVTRLLRWVLRSEHSGDRLVQALAAADDTDRPHPRAGGESAQGLMRLFPTLWRRFAETTLRLRWVLPAGAVAECAAVLAKAGPARLPWTHLVWLLPAKEGTAEGRLAQALRDRGVSLTVLDPAQQCPEDVAALAEFVRRSAVDAPAPTAAPSAALTLLRLRGDAEEARWIAGEVWRLVAAGVAPREIGILSPAPARDLGGLALALHRSGIPCGPAGAEAPERWAWGWLDAFLRLQTAPDEAQRGAAWLRLAALGAFQLPPGALHDLRRGPAAETDRRIAAAALDQPEPATAVALAARRELLELAANPGAAGSLEALVGRLAAVAGRARPEEAVATGIGWTRVRRFAAVCDALCPELDAGTRLRFLLRHHELAPEVFGPEPEDTAADGVHLLTLADAAGMTFHTVFVPTLTDGVLPRPMPAAPFGPDRGLFARLAGLAAGPPPWPATMGEHLRREAGRLAGAIASATDGVVLSTVLRVGERPAEPSLFFEALAAAFPAALVDPASRADAPHTLASWGADLLRARLAGGLAPAAFERLAMDAGLPHLTEAVSAGVLPVAAPVIGLDPPELTPGAVHDFQRCPRHFYYRHLVRLPRESPRSAGLAAAVHAALQQVGARQVDARQVDTLSGPGAPAAGTEASPAGTEAQRTLAEFLRDWSRRADAPAAGVALTVSGLVERYLAAEQGSREGPAARPETLHFERAGFAFRVEVDYCTAAPLTLMDHHVGRLLDAEAVGRTYFGLLKTKTRDAENLKLHLFVVGAEAVWGEVPDAVGLYAVGSVDAANPGERHVLRSLVPRAQFERNRQTLDAQLDGLLARLRSGEFPAQPQNLRDCRNCDFRLVCDRERPAAFRQADGAQAGPV